MITTTSFESFSIVADSKSLGSNNTLDHAQYPDGRSSAVLCDTYNESALAKLWTSMVSRGYLESGIDRRTGQINGYMLMQASWAAAVAKLLDGESTIDPIAETGASTGFAGIQISSDGRWEAYWAGGARVAVVPNTEIAKISYCEDDQPFQADSLNSLINSSLPLNTCSGQIMEASTVLLVDSSSSNFIASTIVDDGIWPSEAGLLGLVRKAQLRGGLGTSTVSAVVGRVNVGMAFGS